MHRAAKVLTAVCCVAALAVAVVGLQAGAPADEGTSPAVTETAVSDDLVEAAPQKSEAVQADTEKDADADEEAAAPQQADDGLISAGHLYDGLAISDIPVPDEGQEGSSYAAGEAIVLFTDGTSEGEAAAVLSSYGLSADAQQIDEALVTRSFCTASVDDGSSVASVLRAIKAQGPAAIQFAQANYCYELADADTTQTDFLDASVSEITTQTTHINDPYASELWQLDAINAYDAWDIQKTEESVSVAVVDTGVALEHEDLKDQLIDTYNATDDGGTAEDVDLHGTHVAGIVAATTDNDIGVSGASYNAGLFCARVQDSDGQMLTSYLLNAYEWILEDDDQDGVSDKYEDNNLRVVNMSLGSPGMSEEDLTFSQAVETAYDQGILSVAAAGNSSLEETDQNTAFFPADYEPCMSVIALDQSMTRAYYSNYGPSKDIAAPGTNILSSVPPDKAEDPQHPYGLESGTSMASPVVAGSAAVVFAYGLATGEDYSPDEVRELLQMSARDLGEPGFDIETAWGCVDLEAALKASTGEHTVTISGGDHATLVRDDGQRGVSFHETVAFGETLAHTYTVQPAAGYTFAAFEGDDTRAYGDLSDLRITYDVSYTALCLPADADETSLVLALRDDEELEPTLTFGAGDTVIVDWGDGTEPTSSADGTATHTYAETGTYVLTLASDASYQLGSGAGVSFIDEADYASSVLAIATDSNAVPMRSSFYGFNKMVTADLGVCGDTSQVQDMANLFYDCSNLEMLDIGGLDTSAATDMSAFFYGCIRLTELDLSDFDTSQVTNMSGMFENCSTLTLLDVSALDTAQVTNMTSLFQGCSLLRNLDLSALDTSQVTDMTSLFMNCTALADLDLSGLDTSQVTTMSGMFLSCTSLTELDLSSFDTSQVTVANDMFSHCTSLTELDLSGFDTSKLEVTYNMFHSCYYLSSIDLSGWDTSHLRFMAYMFYSCYSLASLDLSSFDTSQIMESYGGLAGMASCFTYCVSLRQITLSDAFTFNGASDERQCALPVSYALPYEVTGEWVDIATGTAYDCDEVPNNTAATYYAQSAEPQIFDEDDFEVSPLTLSYTGKALMPDVVSDLFEGTEYTLSATDNVEPGTATLTINGAGNYAGSKLTYQFKITGKSGGSKASKNKKQTIKCKSKVKLKKGGKKLKVKVKGVKTTLCWKANKKAQKALKIKTGTKTLTLKALKKAKKGKTYKIKLWAGVGNNFKKSNVKTIKVKVK